MNTTTSTCSTPTLTPKARWTHSPPLGLALLVFLGVTAWAQTPAGLRGPWFFQRTLEPVAESSAALQDAALLKTAIDKVATQDPAEVAALLDAFVTDYPASAWTPALRANLARHYAEEGAFTRALQHWESAWEATKLYPNGAGKRVADYALAQWTRKLLAMGRLEELGVILAESRGRLLDAGPLQQTFLRTCASDQIVRAI